MKKIVTYIICFSLLFVITACAAFRQSVKQETLMKKEVLPGSYTLILYGARHSEDLETVAMLDLEGDEYTFTPYAPDYDYRKAGPIGQEQALAEAEKFVRWHPSNLGSRLSVIKDMQGNILGYELRPLYSSIMAFGYSNVINVHYYLKDKKVMFIVRLRRPVERALRGDESEH